MNGFGCKHYYRNCLIITDCCKRSYPCRHCHDLNEDHIIDRHKTKEMLCLFCGLIQEASNKCKKCENFMARYFCTLCKFWTNDVNTYHCMKCKLCRKGNPKDFFHCDECSVCMQIELKDNHRHIENTLKSTCPICADYLFDSVFEILQLKCGHPIHEKCYFSYKSSSIQCPICLKSSGHTNTLNKKIDHIIQENNTIQKETTQLNCELSCYDCNRTGSNCYQFLYNKCKRCGSYNTRINEIFKEQ
ncbi:CHY zinc finger domain protein [Spraguea lophii 42_110]|uniref:CHY zinc finger domain protein n=1 Tax=Spraguea lophii (strain 42_110) TaxID=1358809 RepID=S7XGT6_SPRLO|nr:CHY zinc finger domain protein [Spraguea lophii 42_110]